MKVLINVPTKREGGYLRNMVSFEVPCEIDEIDPTPFGNFYWVKLLEPGAGFKKNHRLRVSKNKLIGEDTRIGEDI